MSHYVTIPETRKRTSSVVRHKLVERNMRLQVLLLLCALGVALAQSGCEMNPESCSPDDNHFHRSIKYGYCIANKGIPPLFSSSLWQRFVLVKRVLIFDSQCLRIGPIV
jgi:hypothetical protein